MTDDRGLSALAAAMAHADGDFVGKGSLWLHKAAALLGERGVFLPDGLDALVPWTCIYCEATWPNDEPITVLQEHILVCEKHPIATLRAALEPAERLIEVLDAMVLDEPYALPLRGMRALGDLRAALAAAKKATDHD